KGINFNDINYDLYIQMKQIIPECPRILLVEPKPNSGFIRYCFFNFSNFTCGTKTEFWFH
ncbi:hypothetical protein ACJX0J_030471, partial [Zea mays]